MGLNKNYLGGSIKIISATSGREKNLFNNSGFAVEIVVVTRNSTIYCRNCCSSPRRAPPSARALRATIPRNKICCRASVECRHSLGGVETNIQVVYPERKASPFILPIDFVKIFKFVILNNN